jgi:hypothetical protein
MHSLWLRKKINLNVTPSVSATPTPPPPSEELPRTESTAPSSTNLEEGVPVAAPSSKRKLRSTRGEEGSKRSRVVGGSTVKEYVPPTVRLADLGGVDPCVEKMLELVAMPLAHPEVYLHTGVQPPRGVLLHGPPGCGKTMLANAIGGVRLQITQIIQIPLIDLIRNWVYRLFRFRHHRSCRACRANRKRHSEKRLRRPRCVYLYIYVNLGGGNDTLSNSESHHVCCLLMRLTQSHQNGRVHSARWSVVSSPSS